MEILRKTERVHFLEVLRGHWWPFRDPDSGDMGAIISCPLCGKMWSVAGSTSGHVIHDDGRVTASVVCVHNPCEYHDFIQLEGWVQR